MAFSPEQLSQLLKMRALGYSQAEIAHALKTSQQTIAYRLKKLKNDSKKNGMDEVFTAALIGGALGATAGVSLYALLEMMKEKEGNE